VLAELIVIALLWSVPGLAWFGQMGTNERILIMLVTTGMISGAAVVLASLPLASFIYIAILSCVMVSADLRLGFPALAMMSTAYAGTLFWTSLLYGRHFIHHLAHASSWKNRVN
jgi:hypothetical protein